MSTLAVQLENHKSGCSYEMAAVYIKGKRRIIGKNRLTSPAHLKHDIYPYMAGQHAELNVVIRATSRLRGGTLYITGVRASRSRNQMLNTRPCKYCMHVLLTSTDINAIVFFQDGIMVKELL